MVSRVKTPAGARPASLDLTERTAAILGESVPVIASLPHCHCNLFVVQALSISTDFPADVDPAISAAPRALKALLDHAVRVTAISIPQISIVTFIIEQVNTISAYLNADICSCGTSARAVEALFHLASRVATISRKFVSIVAPHLPHVQPITTDLLASVMSGRTTPSTKKTFFLIASAIATIAVEVVTIVALVIVTIEGALAADLRAPTRRRTGEARLHQALVGATLPYEVVESVCVTVFTLLVHDA